MKRWQIAGIAVAAVLLVAYAVGLGIYVVASTAGPLQTQPADVAEAEAAVRALGIEDAYAFEHGFVATPHGRMHYAAAGGGDPVLCLHGNPTWSFVYREFLRGLSPKARVIAPDLIGFGLSEKPGDVKAYSLEGHVEDVSALVTELDLRNLTLVLQDWGAPIGLAVAARHPERVRALVVMNTVSFPEGDAPVALRVARAPVVGEQLVQGLGLYHRAVLPVALAPGSRDKQVLRAYRDVQGSWRERAGVLAFGRLLPFERDDPSRRVFAEADAFLRDFDGPMLVVWGLRDRVFDADELEIWRARFPDAPVLALEDAGHFVQEDAAGRVVPRVRRFLEELKRSEEAR